MGNQIIGQVFTSIVKCLSSPVGINHYLILAAALFCIGVFGLVSRNNAIRVLMSIEIILNAVNINFVAFAHYIDPISIKGQVFSLFVMAVAAAEAAIGLALLLLIYRNKANIKMDSFNILKW